MSARIALRRWLDGARKSPPAPLLQRGDLIPVGIPNWHQFLQRVGLRPLAGIDPASPRCDTFYRALARHDLPLICLKRLLRRNGIGFAHCVFETRTFFDRNAR